MDYQRILVTGGAGFIGSRLTADLLHANYEVSVLDDLSTGSRNSLQACFDSPRFNFVQGSITEERDIERAIEGCDAVIHLAVSNLRKSITDPLASHRINAGGTLSVLETCKRLGIQRFIYISSSEIYGTAVCVPMTESHPLNPETVYASSKLAGEYYCQSYSRMYGLKLSILRPFNNYGPRAHYENKNGEFIPRSILRILGGHPPILFGDGTQTRDFVYVSDTARAIMSCLETESSIGKILNIASGKETSIRALAENLCQLLNAPFTPIYLGASRPGDVQRHFGCGKLAEEILHFKPKLSVEEGLNCYLDWIREQQWDTKKLLEEVQDQNW